MQVQSNYETLRSWYLAKLRKSAIEAQVSGQLTPSALIAADREVIEKLIAERAEVDEKAQKLIRKAGMSSVFFALSLWFYLIMASLAAIFLFCLTDASILVDVLMVAANPANLAASGSSVPNPIVLIVVQSVLYIFPLVALPMAFLGNKEGR